MTRPSDSQKFTGDVPLSSPENSRVISTWVVEMAWPATSMVAEPRSRPSRTTLAVEPDWWHMAVQVRPVVACGGTR